MSFSSVPSRKLPSVTTPRAPRIIIRVISMLPIEAARPSL